MSDTGSSAPRADGSAAGAASRPLLDRPALVAEMRARGASAEAVHLLGVTGSTNADAMALIEAGEPTPLLVLAEEQSEGRGRLRRAWVAPPGSSLLMSLALRPTPPVSAWGWLPLLAGVSAVRGIGEVAGLEVGLKWPNDVMAGDPLEPRKLGGILAESSGTGVVVVGIGLNVDQGPDELPERARPSAPATSLRVEGASPIGREALAAAVVAHLEAELARWEAAGGDPVRSGLADAYRAACFTLDRRVDVWLPGEERVSGTAVDVTDEGLLVLQTADGSRRLAAGDVEHVYPSA